MSFRLNKLFKNFIQINLIPLRTLTTESPKPKKINKKFCVISCKNSRLNHYTNSVYNKLDEIPLASKGWSSYQSKGDYFTVNALPPDYNDTEEDVAFNELGINPNLIKALKSQGIKKATAFQAEAIPTIQQTNKHVLLCAETGCGKTVSYLLPLIQSVIGRKPEQFNTPKILVLVPNRELAYQVGEIAELLATNVDVKVKIIVGGRTKKLMLNAEFEDVDVLVATPGAIGKLSAVGIYRLNEVTSTVLDEADTLVDDSFIERMSGLLKRVSQSQIILVSATIPKTLPDILKPIEPNLQQIISPRIHKPLLNITQKFFRTNRSSKPSLLLNIAKTNTSPMLIFSNRNETCNWLAMFLRENGVECSHINGDMNYALRIEQWNKFISGNKKILSATDVGSRGLNTTQVKHVLNYDFPIYSADYLHRIGRIGRLGSVINCRATNFISGPEEVQLVKQIEYAIRRDQALDNVDGNITNILQRKISRGLRQSMN